MVDTVPAPALEVYLAELDVVVPALDCYLWGLAVLVFGVGDVLTTVVGVRRFGLTETNPIVVRLAGRRPSAAATLLFKAGVLAAGGAVYLAVLVAFGRSALAVPLLLVVFGGWAIQANLLNVAVAVARRRGDDG